MLPCTYLLPWGCWSGWSWPGFVSYSREKKIGSDRQEKPNPDPITEKCPGSIFDLMIITILISLSPSLQNKWIRTQGSWSRWSLPRARSYSISEEKEWFCQEKPNPVKIFEKCPESGSDSIILSIFFISDLSGKVDPDLIKIPGYGSTTLSFTHQIFSLFSVSKVLWGRNVRICLCEARGNILEIFCYFIQ